LDGFLNDLVWAEANARRKLRKKGSAPQSTTPYKGGLNRINCLIRSFGHQETPAVAVIEEKESAGSAHRNGNEQAPPVDALPDHLFESTFA